MVLYPFSIGFSFINYLVAFSKVFWILFKGRFLEFRTYHNFSNLFSKLSEGTFYKEINKFQKKSIEL